MNIVSLSDLNKEDKNAKKNVTSSFTGGEKSGLAVENPSKGEEGFSWKTAQVAGELPPGSRKVTVYKNGFKVDDGEFRPNTEPLNVQFLNDLKEGLAPKELQKGSSTPLSIALEDKSSETFVPPSPPKYTLFSGSGQSLSSGSQSASQSSTVDITKGTVDIDETQPVTTLNLRFHNGVSRTQVFNQSHTVGDLHNCIMECAPVSVPYILLTGFPPKELSVDPTTTLKSAGLINEVVTQKLV